MRYLIETKEQEMKIGAQIAQWQKKGVINIIEKGDPIDQIKTELLRISKAFETLQKLGINQDIMIAYIRDKGISKTAIRQVLYHQKDFFKKLGVMK